MIDRMDSTPIVVTELVDVVVESGPEKDIQVHIKRLGLQPGHFHGKTDAVTPSGFELEMEGMQ